MSSEVTKYMDEGRVAKELRAGRHRAWVGGLWAEIGSLQFEYLKQQGLQPHNRLLDIGCGCFRAGVHFIQYLAPKHYFGIDTSEELLNVGYDKEIVPLGLDEKLPRDNLLADSNFSFDRLDSQFDMAIAQSLFTHLPSCYLSLCLSNLAAQMQPGGMFYATFFLVTPKTWARSYAHPSGITTHPVIDPFHYREADIQAAAAGLPWQVEIVGDWGHPRGQSMVKFIRLEGANGD